MPIFIAPAGPSSEAVTERDAVGERHARIADHIIFLSNDIVHIEPVEDVLAPEVRAPVIILGCNTDLEIHDTVLIAAAFCMMNRYVDGLATIAPDDPAVYAAGAQHLIHEGYIPPAAP